MNVVNLQNGRNFFLYGYGKKNKTFMWRNLASTLCSHGHIVLTVASSGITSLLLPDERTAHSKFAIPVPILQNSTGNIHQGSELVELLKVTKLIIWNEASMTHKFWFEALDKTFRDIMSFSAHGDSPFRGKIVVFGGEFR